MTTTIDPPSISSRYRSSRLRLDEALRSAADRDWEAEVAACPGWRVRDVLAHLLGVVEDALAGRIAGPPTPEQTAQEVDRHRHDDPRHLLDQWSATAPAFEEALDALEIWPAFFDVLSHEHDVRGALGDRSFRDHDDVVLAASLLAEGLPSELQVVLDERPVDPSGSRAVVRLSTSSFELLRLRLGRRSRAQVLALDWDGDPAGVVDRLFIFGPAARDLVE